MIFNYHNNKVYHDKLQNNDNAYVVCSFFVNKISFCVGDKFIRSIDRFGKCELSTEEYFFNVLKSNNFIHIKDNNSKYFSALNDGSFSFVEEAGEKEQFLIS